jgi:glutamate dehydrogenase
MFSQHYIETTLSDYPIVSKLLVDLFELSFNTQQPKDLTERVMELEKNIHTEIDKVSSLDEDRILRRYLDVIHATLRTNYLLDKNYLSFKLNPHAIPEIPLPLPMYEVFVYSPRFEAVHLRAAKVARGGIRWSDRREDFRTEILGLMKAQKVKNSVIVPSGAKGGFIPKCLPVNGTREEVMAEVIECYKNFMRGLLDLTDNFIDGKITPPHDVVCFDDNDPYLVVAADKGTASFSDIANSISKEYNFWLGDAFASGGSAGYDHKKMAITARGAWESVQRHFREMGTDIQSTDFTVVGIGDMSGDVFGNGMLRSEHIKLVAAFDHRDIFIDPTPDAKKSFAERTRMFNLPRSSWEDYDPKLISTGGGVFKRTAKSITLTPEIKKLFNLEVDQIAPNELIKVILTAPVDLLWNGGIGTYVKANFERNADIGDRTNDFVRVNGGQLRAKVIGEGGNLGCSQLGRVEYSLQGGRCNTDFIDNSGGVDCSDHEVNIKILLNEVVAKNDLTEKQRNKLLADMTDEIAILVLSDNYQQALAISLAHVHAKTHAELYRRYLSDKEKAGLIDRQLEFLPTDKELVERKIQNISLTRPELAVVLSYSKINLKAAILASDIPEDAFLKHIITTAFPQMLQKKFSSQIMVHRLHREIIATQISSNLVNQMGAVFIYRMQDETGASVAEIVRAYSAAAEIFKVEGLYELVNGLDQQVPADIQIEMLLHVKRLLRRATRWLLRNRRIQLDVKECISYFGNGVAKIIDVIPSLMVGVTKEYMENLTRQFIEVGLSPAIASRIAGCRAMYTALNIVDLATQFKFDLVESAKVFFAVGAKLELAWFRDQMNANATEDYWDSIARASLRDDLDIQQRIITISILQRNQEIKNVDKRITAWLTHFEPLIERWLAILANMRSATNLSFIMFYVAVRELYDLTALISQSN